MGPFQGLRVVEFGRFIAAPYCCQLLADGGAEVVKIEPPTGDETRRNGEVIPGEGRQFLNKNRGKKSVVADLSDSHTLRKVQELAAEADVVVANFRPGQAAALKLDYASLSSANPRLIYAENSAFGPSGPMAGQPGMDLALVAYSGLAPMSDFGPIDLENPVVDYTAGLLLAWGISTALYEREQSGKGQHVEVSLLQAALVVQNNTVNHIDVIDEWRQTFVAHARELLENGASVSEILAYREHLQPHAINRAYYGFYRAADGFIAIAALGRANQLQLLIALGVDDPWVSQPGWLPADAREHARHVRAAVEEKVRARTVNEWLTTLQNVGVPVAPVRFRDELLADEQVWANEYLVRLEHELIGGITVVAPPVKFSVTPLKAQSASPPLGKHTEEFLGP